MLLTGRYMHNVGIYSNGGSPALDDALLPDRLKQVIPPVGAEGLKRRPPAGSCRLLLGPGFQLAARWNRLDEAVKTRKK